jgi:hypothetical protein
MRHFSIGFVLCVVFLQCSTKSKMTVPTDVPFLSLATSGCRGYCPVFRVDIMENGIMQYKPEMYCAVSENKTIKLTPSQLERIKSKSSLIPYKKYPAYIESTIADAPMATLTFHEKDSSYSITGTIDRPKALIALEYTIRDICKEHEIDTRKPFDPNETLPGNASQLLVQLKEEINAGNWIATIQVGNPRLLRRIPPNNAWVLSFDHTQIGLKEMIAVIEGSVDVIQVQQNQRTKDRQ